MISEMDLIEIKELLEKNGWNLDTIKSMVNRKGKEKESNKKWRDENKDKVKEYGTNYRNRIKNKLEKYEAMLKKEQENID